MNPYGDRLARNSAWMVLSRFGAQGLAVLFTILLARQLGSAGFGEYAFIAAVVFVANAFTTFGTDMLLIREIAARDDLAGLAPALLIQLGLSALSIIGIWVLSASIPNQGEDAILALQIYVLALVPLAFFTVCTTALRGVQRMADYTRLNLLTSALQVGAVLVLGEGSLAALSALLLLVQLLSALFALWICMRLIPGFAAALLSIGSYSISRLMKLVRAAAPIAGLAVIGIVFQRLGVQLLSILSGPTETGIYTAAFRAVEASKTAHLAVFAALYPALAQVLSSAAEARPTAQRNWQSVHMKYLKLLVIGAGVISMLLFLLARPLVALLYGTGFLPASNVLQILAWCLIPFTINTFLALWYLSSSRERSLGRALTGSLLGLLILNLWWIPTGGAEGAAWAALGAECLQSILLIAGAGSFVKLKGDAHGLSQPS